MTFAHESDRLRARKVELIVGQVESLPTLPAIAAQLLQLTLRPGAQAADVSRLIESDPALASRIIALATRANRGLRAQTASVSRAVVMLGFNAVRNAVLSIKVFEVLGGAAPPAPGRFDRVGFWKHSLAVGCAARLVIPHLDPKTDPEEAFVCGLLHDLGKVALDACLPKSFARVIEITESSRADIAEVERQVLGIDHATIGKRLAERWQLPDEIVAAIWLHHQDPDAMPAGIPGVNIVHAVHLADLIAREQRIGYSGNHLLHESSAQLARRLGLDPKAIEDVARRLGEELAERAELLGLEAGSEAQVYFEALSAANRELGQLNAHLQSQAQSLQRRSAYFELLRDLAARLDERRSTAEVCGLIAQLWREHTSARLCAAYARGPEDELCEGGLALPYQNTPSLFLAQPPDQDAIAEENPAWGETFAATKAAWSHGWFFEEINADFDLERTFVIPLTRARRPLGAIIWEAPTTPDDSDPDDYRDELAEMEAFASGAALAILQAQRLAQQRLLSEDLVEANRRLRETQQQLLQQRSLAAVGEMACGAAHEINNPLAVIVGRSQFLAAGENDEKRRAILEKIIQNGQGVSDIITELLEFAQPEVPKIEPHSLQKLMESAVEAVQERSDEARVGITVKLSPEIGDVTIDARRIRVMADARQIGVALTEVLWNAIEASRESRSAVLVTAGLEDANLRMGKDLNAPPAVVVEVTDQGVGMDPETLGKALDPFFSARPAGRGRGLGLSRASRYVEVNGGSLALHSEPGKGTRVRIVLPGAEA